MLHFCLLCCVLFVGFIAAQEHVYVSPHEGSKEFMCGSAHDSPCHGLAAFLNRTGQVRVVGQILVLNGSTIPSTQRRVVHLYPGIYQTQPIFLYGIHNWSFVGASMGGGVSLSVTSFHGVYNLLGPYTSKDSFNNSTQHYFAALYFRECSGIEVVNIDFSVSNSNNVTGLSVLTIDYSREFDVIGCAVNEVSTNSSALVVINPTGPIAVRSFLIWDLYSVYRFRHLILIVLGNQLQGMGNSVTVTLSNITVMDIMQSNCIDCPLSLKEILSGAIPYPRYDYQFNTKSAGVVFVQFKVKTSKNTVILENSSFKRILPAGHDSPLTVQFAGANNNSVIIRNCTFFHNSGYFGGAASVVFTGTAKDNSITFSDCRFEANSALYNGGAVAIEYFHDQVANNVMFERCHFERNSASFGGAVMAKFITMTDFHISKYKRHRLLKFVDCYLFNNTADHGIIDGHSVVFKAEGQNMFQNNTASCFGLRHSELDLSGTPSFIGNKALDGAVVLVHTDSQISLVNVTKAYFQNNFAARRGGVVWADHDTTAVTYDQFLLTSIKCIDTSEPCFIQFGNENYNQPCDTGTQTIESQTRVIFDGNQAGVVGDVFHSYSFRHCWLGNFIPYNPSGTVSLSGLNYIVTEFRNQLGNYTAGSAPNFFALIGASCRCFKPVGSMNVSVHQCRHDDAHAVFSNISALKYSASLLAEEFYGGDSEGLTDFSNPAAGIGVTPTADLLYFPWSFTVYSDDKKPGKKRASATQQNPSLITLTPSPGEELELNFTVRGQFMEPTDSTAYIQVVADENSHKGIFLEYNGIAYPSHSRIPFAPSHPFSGLRLHGLEGATGSLVVSTISQVLVEELTISIPFILARCPMGFFAPAATSFAENEVSELFKFTMPRPVSTPGQLSNLTCNCYNLNKAFQDVVMSCESGRTAFMHKWEWLGNPTFQKFRNTSEVSCTLIDFDSNNVEVTCYADDPASVVAAKEEVATADCVLNFCRDSKSGTGTWTEIDGPCSDHREGPLCGLCEDGYSITPSSLECVKCSYYYGWLVIFLTLLCGFLLVLAAVLMNLSISPIAAAVLFFTQMADLFIDVDSNVYTIVHLVNLDFTFGLCYSSDLNAMHRLAFQFVPSVYVFTLVMLFLLASKLPFFTYLSRRSCLKGVWTIILLSYFSLSNVTFGFLKCVEMKSADNTSTIYHRFLDNPSISCYESEHLIWFVISCVVVALVLLPFPFLILFLRRSARFRPFADVCYSLYKDSRWWWCSFDLLRRLLFAAINTFVPAQDDRTLKSSLLIGAAVFVLLVHGIEAPYQSRLENAFESLVLFDLCCLGIIAAGWDVKYVTGYIPVLVYLPWLCGFGLWIYMKRDGLRKFARRFGIHSGYQALNTSDSSLHLNKLENNGSSNTDDDDDDDDNPISLSDKQHEESWSVWGNLSLEPGLRDPLLDDQTQ